MLDKNIINTLSIISTSSQECKEKRKNPKQPKKKKKPKTKVVSWKYVWLTWESSKTFVFKEFYLNTFMGTAIENFGVHESGKSKLMHK